MPKTRSSKFIITDIFDEGFGLPKSESQKSSTNQQNQYSKLPPNRAISVEEDTLALKSTKASHENLFSSGVIKSVIRPTPCISLMLSVQKKIVKKFVYALTKLERSDCSNSLGELSPVHHYRGYRAENSYI